MLGDVDRRRDALVAHLDVEDLQALAQRQRQVVGRLGAAQLGVERRAALQADAQDPVLARQHAALAREVVEPALAVLDQAARVVDLGQVVEHQLLPAHRRQRPELDVRRPSAPNSTSRAPLAPVSPKCRPCRQPEYQAAGSLDTPIAVWTWPSAQ